MKSSSIVPLDDDFGSIVKSIRPGRRIYDNLRKVMGFIFAVHIAFLEMVIDPVCSIAFEAEVEENDIMRRHWSS